MAGEVDARTYWSRWDGPRKVLGYPFRCEECGEVVEAKAMHEPRPVPDLADVRRVLPNWLGPNIPCGHDVPAVYQEDEVPEVDGTVPPEAEQMAVQAVRVARGEGCTCVPNVEVMPLGTAPWWSVMLYHDESCTRVQRFLGETVTGD